MVKNGQLERRTRGEEVKIETKARRSRTIDHQGRLDILAFSSNYYLATVPTSFTNPLVTENKPKESGK